MQKRLIGVVVIVILFAALALIMMFGTNLIPGSGYRVTLQGTVSYYPWPGPGWDVTYSGYQINRDSWWPFSFGNTGNIKVEGILQNQDRTYRSEVDVGQVSLVVGGTKNYGVVLRNVQNGTYTLTLHVYEVHNFFDIPFLPQDRVLQATETFSGITISEYGGG